VTAELYHAALVAKARSGVGKGRLADATASARIDNPLCGDRVTLDIHLEDGRITAVGHEVRGCLLCEAAAATIAELAPGKTVVEARDLAAGITAMMKDGAQAPLAELAIFTPVHAAKSRRDCVLLPFGALAKALSGF
jgi:nitrogen fixation NifU-like protein